MLYKWLEPPRNHKNLVVSYSGLKPDKLSIVISDFIGILLLFLFSYGRIENEPKMVRIRAWEVDTPFDKTCANISIKVIKRVIFLNNLEWILYYISLRFGKNIILEEHVTSILFFIDFSVSRTLFIWATVILRYNASPKTTQCHTPVKISVWTHPHQSESFFAVWQCFENHWISEENYLSLGSRLSSQYTSCL